MEIKCQTCDHLGTPKSVNPTEDGIVFICAECGGENLLFTESSNGMKRTKEDSQEISEPKTERVATLEKLLPEKGEGPRCPKCLAIIRENSNSVYCYFCGLDLSKNYDVRPWEKAPPGKEEEYEQALLLWNSIDENPIEENFKKFFEFTRFHEFFDLQVRKLRNFLVEHEDHPMALAYLEEISTAIQARVIIAQSQSQTRAEESAIQFEKLRKVIFVVAVVLLFVLIGYLMNVIY